MPFSKHGFIGVFFHVIQFQFRKTQKWQPSPIDSELSQNCRRNAFFWRHENWKWWKLRGKFIDWMQKCHCACIGSFFSHWVRSIHSYNIHFIVQEFQLFSRAHFFHHIYSKINTYSKKRPKQNSKKIIHSHTAYHSTSLFIITHIRFICSYRFTHSVAA